jgi:putative membrane protein
MHHDPTGYAVQRDHVARYFYWTHILAILLMGIWFFGIGLVVAVLYAVTLGTWLPQRQATALRYWLDGSTLRADSGVYFLKRKAIPLDRVTDVVLSQGPLLRWCGLWSLQIQTAGMGGQSVAEVTLYGLERPEEVRDELLRARDQAARRATA